MLASYSIKEPVLSVFEEVPREFFIPKEFSSFAYEDRALPIGFGQTTSQPSLIAMTLQSLNLKGYEKALEVGTGSGFQTALLAHLAREVISIERIPDLSRLAQKNLEKTKIKNVKLIVGDGTLGYPENAPYDAILISAAFKSVPEALRVQLREGGKLIMPVGDKESQELYLYTKVDGYLKILRRVADVRFVPLIGKQAWGEK